MRNALGAYKVYREAGEAALQTDQNCLQNSSSREPGKRNTSSSILAGIIWSGYESSNHVSVLQHTSMI